MQITKDTPKNMTQLLRAACLHHWKGKKCEHEFYTNVQQAIAVLGEDMEISTYQIDQYRNQLQQKYKPATVNKKLVNLHTVLSYGYDRDWIKRKPKFTFNTIDNSRTRHLSVSEEAALLGWFRSRGHDVMAAFCELLILTGCRKSELLKAKKVQVQGNWLRLQNTKNGKPRSIPLTPRAKELADQCIPFALDYFEIYLLWNQAKSAIGMAHDTEFVLHCLRHTFATRLLKKSKRIEIVQKALGHADIKMTLRYAHVEDSDLMEAVTA